VAARAPLGVTAAAGRAPAAVDGLVALADAGAVAVLEASPVALNFPADHPCHAGYAFGSRAHPAVGEADAILVVDCDVPWYPSRARPREETRVIQMAVDPFFTRYPMRSFPCDVPIAAEPAVALPLLAEAVRRRAPRADVEARRARLAAAHRAARAAARAAAEAERSRTPIGFQWAAQCLAEVVTPDTVVVNEYPLDLRHVPLTVPGSYLGSPPAGALGWGLGAALGVKLAAPEKTVVAALGDGAYIFGAPTAAHWVARAHDLPVLTVLFDNEAWEAVTRANLTVHPDGWAAGTRTTPLASLAPAPRYEEIVRAFDGHGERVEAPDALPAALRRALDVVRQERRQAVVNVLCRR
jgi:acetolactate synthase-1/2/3 large subunit